MKRTIAVILCLVSMLAFPLRARALSVSASSAVVIEAESGRIIYEKDAHTRRGMASTTKIMTALCAIENLALDTIVTVPREAVGVEGSSVYLKEGEQISLEDLLYALMLQSANDAAAAIAIAVSGSIEDFACLMNEKAAALGLTDTHFENPHGLDGSEHYTTAYELAKIAAHALENEDFARIVSTKLWKIQGSDGSAPRALVNHNRLLREYRDIIGVKTGFTRKCGRTLVSAARRNGVTLVCVTLNDGDDWRDHRAMLDFGFDLYENEELCAEGELSFEIPTVGGDESSASVSNREAIFAVLPKSHGDVSVKIELPRFVYAGQKKDAPIGKARFFCDGREIGCAALYLDREIAVKAKKKLFK